MRSALKTTCRSGVGRSAPYPRSDPKAIGDDPPKMSLQLLLKMLGVRPGLSPFGDPLTELF